MRHWSSDGSVGNKVCSISFHRSNNSLLTIVASIIILIIIHIVVNICAWWSYFWYAILVGDVAVGDEAKPSILFVRDEAKMVTVGQLDWWWRVVWLILPILLSSKLHVVLNIVHLVAGQLWISVDKVLFHSSPVNNFTKVKHCWGVFVLLKLKEDYATRGKKY